MDKTNNETIYCNACGAQFLRKDKKCPSCGKKNSKQFYRKWWFWVLIVIVIGVNASSNDTNVSDNNSNTTNHVETDTVNEEQETKSQKDTLSIVIEGGCRALTKNFVEGAMGEKYSMLAFSVEEYDLDENENGTIKVLYLPSNAGTEGATKANLTISKNGGTYKIEYAMLAGMYEVDLEGVSKKYTELVTE